MIQKVCVNMNQPKGPIWPELVATIISARVEVGQPNSEVALTSLSVTKTNSVDRLTGGDENHPGGSGKHVKRCWTESCAVWDALFLVQQAGNPTNR